jgi:homoserine kinase
LGGITFIRDNRSLDVHALPVPTELYAAVVYPEVEVLTKDSRAVLSDTVRLSATIQQTGNLGALLVGLYESNYNLIARALEDAIIEPQRARLIPNFYGVKSAALKAGALGASISGAGPSVFALCRGEAAAQRAGHAMQAAFLAVNVRSHVFVSVINTSGTVRMD